MITIVSHPDWTSFVTAIGTVVVAAVAVSVALFAEWRTGKRLRAEHERSDKLLADERALSEARLREERQLFHEREQLAGAYAVQVALITVSASPDEGVRLFAPIVNHSSLTITRIEAKFSTDGRNVSPHRRQERIPGLSNVPHELRATGPSAELASYGDRLTPWDVGMWFDTHPIAAERLTDPGVMVRWTDRWGTRWEYQRGEVQKIEQGAEWTA